MRNVLLILVAAAMAPAQTPQLPEKVTIQQAVSEAIDRNLDLAAARFNISIADARLITAGLKPNPVLTVSAWTLDVFGGYYNPDNPAGPNQLNFHTDYILERGGKRQNRIAVATADKSLAALGIRDQMRHVILAAQGAFLDVQQAEQSLALAQENLKSLQGIVRVNEAKVKSGELAPVELDRSRLAELQYETQVDQARLTTEQAKLKLQLLMGRKSPSPAFEVDGPIRREASIAPPDVLHTQAMERRPDILGARQAETRSKADLKLQIANGKVDYTLGAEISYQHGYGMGGPSMGLSFSAPLPFYNRNQGEIARAQHEIQQAAARVQSLEANAALEVDSAYRQYLTSQKLLQNIETNMLAKARSVRDITEYSYRRGEASLVEFLDAQRAFNDAMEGYNEARTAYARSLYLIDSVTGATATPDSGSGSVIR